MSRSLILFACSIIAGALPFSCYPAFAQQPQGPNSNALAASITGKITIATGVGTTNDVAGVVVSLTGPSVGAASQTTVTDAEGQYQFARLAAGTYTLEVTEDGFKPWSAMIALGANQALVEDIALQINTVSQDVEVRGEATEIDTQSSAAATSTVSSQQLDTLPLPTQKFTEALSLVPGVIRTPEGKLSFKGQAESQGMLVVDSRKRGSSVGKLLDSHSYPGHSIHDGFQLAGEFRVRRFLWRPDDN